jgi:hypothetical protein
MIGSEYFHFDLVEVYDFLSAASFAGHKQSDQSVVGCAEFRKFDTPEIVVVFEEGQAVRRFLTLILNHTDYASLHLSICGKTAKSNFLIYGEHRLQFDRGAMAADDARLAMAKERRTGGEVFRNDLNRDGDFDPV